MLNAFPAPLQGEGASGANALLYTVIGIIILALIFLLHYMQYTVTYLGTYQESERRRITLAEKLRTLPLRFFHERDLSDLTSTIMGDCAGFEHAFSHTVAQFWGSILSAAIVCIALLIYDWRMGLALLWVAPVSFAIVLLSRRLQVKLGKMHMEVDRLKAIQNYPEEKGEKNYHTNGYDITFDHVGFSYEPGKPVLKDVSFTARQGQVTALVGPSGGGKSTIANLAAGFYDVDSGRITLGGTDIAPIDSTALMKDFSVVFQNVVLFNNTVMENSRVGRKDATDEDVMAAAKAAHCHEFIEKLPQGYQTVIGENGSTLSGGECLRLSIAHALLKDAPVILLDEATASLDADGGKRRSDRRSGRRRCGGARHPRGADVEERPVPQAGRAADRCGRSETAGINGQQTILLLRKSAYSLSK